MVDINKWVKLDINIDYVNDVIIYDNIYLIKLVVSDVLINYFIVIKSGSVVNIVGKYNGVKVMKVYINKDFVLVNLAVGGNKGEYKGMMS